MRVDGDGLPGGGDGVVTADVRPGATPVVVLGRKVDASNVLDLRQVLGEVCATSTSVVLDMADTTFIDGSVLSVLAQANARLPQGLRVRGARGLVARAFHLVDLEHLLDPAGP